MQTRNTLATAKDKRNGRKASRRNRRTELATLKGCLTASDRENLEGRS